MNYLPVAAEGEDLRNRVLPVTLTALEEEVLLGTVRKEEAR